MRKILAVLILIVLGIVFYFYVGRTIEKKNQKAFDTIGISEENILLQATDNYNNLLKRIRKLQVNPDQIAELNCMITKLLYSGKLTDEEIKLLLKLQREYYSQETLNKNPEDVHFERFLEELERYKEANYYIIGYKIIGPQFIEVEKGDKPMLVFNTIYYMNVTTDEGEVYKGYIFEQNENKLWELKGFGTIDKFPTINN